MCSCVPLIVKSYMISYYSVTVRKQIVGSITVFGIYLSFENLTGSPKKVTKNHQKTGQNMSHFPNVQFSLIIVKEENVDLTFTLKKDDPKKELRYLPRRVKNGSLSKYYKV